MLIKIFCMCDNKLNKFYPDTFITLKTNRTG